MTFKIGDRVIVTGDYLKLYGKTGTVVRVEPDMLCLVQFTNRTDLHDGRGMGEGFGGDKWFVLTDDLARAPVAKPSLADALRLRKGDRTILAHLEAGKPITPMKALVVYGYSRLAANIHRLRTAGYNISTEVLSDEAGHRYASYQLVRS